MSSREGHDTPPGYDDDGNRIRPPKRRPPITGMPAERPRCATCGKRLLPSIEATFQTPAGRPFARECTGRRFTGWVSHAGQFHSLACAARFAGLAFEAGYRLRKRP